MKHCILWCFFFCLALCGCQPEANGPLLVGWRGGQYGFINTKGSFVIRPQFAYAMPFSEGLAAVNVGGSAPAGHMPVNGKWGFIDTLGRFVINPQFLSPISSGVPFDPGSLALALHGGYMFSEGKAAVCKEGEWVYINRSGQTVIRDTRIQSARPFSEGRAAVFFEGGWGYIDASGREVTAPMFQYPADYKEGKAFVTISKNGRRIIIDQNGNQVLSQVRFTGPFENGLAPAKPHYRKPEMPFFDDVKAGAVNELGGPVVESIYDRVGPYSEKLAPVLIGSEPLDYFRLPDEPRSALWVNGYKGGKWGYVDGENVIRINPLFDEAKEFREGRAPVRQGANWGYIDPAGNWAIWPQFAWAGPFSQGVAKVRLGPQANDYRGKYAYLQPDGKVFWVE